MSVDPTPEQKLKEAGMTDVRLMQYQRYPDAGNKQGRSHLANRKMRPF